jgi:hypothetical protein
MILPISFNQPEAMAVRIAGSRDRRLFEIIIGKPGIKGKNY